MILSVGLVWGFVLGAQGELTLEQCAELAGRYHPRLTAAAHHVRVSEARVGQARSGSLPMVDVTVSYARATSNFTGAPGSLPESFLTNPAYAPIGSNTSFNSWGGAMTARHTLFDFGRTGGAIQAEQRSVEASEASRRLVKSELAYELTRAYYQCLQAQHVVGVREDSVRQMAQHLARAKTKFAAGDRPKTDVTKAEVDLANAKLALIQSQSDIKVAWLGLQQAIGFPSEPLPDRVAERVEPVVNITMGTEAAVSQALAQRPELALIQLQIAGAQYREIVAESGFYPTLGALAQYDWRGREFPLTHNWFIGMSLTVPVFSGFLTTFHVDETRAATEALRAQSQTVTQAIRVEVEQAITQLQTMAEQVKAAEVVVRHAVDHLELTQSRYDAGAGSLVDLTDAQVALNAAEVQRIRAQTEYAVAKARWERALGSLTL